MKLMQLWMRLAAAAAIPFLAGCGEESTAPEPVPADPVRHYTRKDVHPEGTVVETANGFTVEGALSVDNEAGQTTFLQADLDVRFDAEGRLMSVSGAAEIPPPNDRITFANPIRADVGYFSGKFLNDNRDLPLLLEGKFEYFVFDFAVAVEMQIHDDDSESEAAITLRAPVGGRVLMIADYNDPMYFVYGEHDLTGGYGLGESARGRIPYVPIRPATAIYSFGGKSIRVGQFQVKSIFEATGTIIEGTHVGIDLVADPIEANFEAGYVYGINGKMDLAVDVRNVVEFTMPIATGSAAMRADLGTGTGVFAGAFFDGLADPDTAWWPELIPIKPIASLLVRGKIETTGAFDLLAHGEFGIGVYGEPEKLVGDFHVTSEALTVGGAVVTGEATYALTGRITGTETTVSVSPPTQLLERIGAAVNDELSQSISEAEQAWENLQEATANYEVELSLRGLRPILPVAIDVAKAEIGRQINAHLQEHEGTIYYGSLRSFLLSEDDKYYRALDNLKALALSTQDTDAWRAGIETALRTAASYEWFDETFRYTVLGQVVATVHIRVRILSDSQAAQLLQAAANVRHIEETWELKVRAQDIYDSIPAKEIFERVRDDIRNGVVQIPTMTELGYVQPHLSPDITIFAIIDGTRHEIDNANLFDLAAMSAAAAKKMVELLIGE